MEIYFVRHGATRANKRHVYQSPAEPLSDAGSRDVAKLVRTVAELQPTHLYSSDYTRARQTADYLSYATNLEVQWQPVMRELGYPEALLGHAHASFATLRYGWQWYFNNVSLATQHGAESRQDFIARVQAARTFLESHAPTDRIVVVSHSFFINAFVEHMCRTAPEPWWRAVPRALNVFLTDNTGLTHMQYESAPTNACGWKLISFDSIKHLGA